MVTHTSVPAEAVLLNNTNPTCRARVEAGDSNEAVKASARGLLLWKAALARGLLPDDVTLAQLADDVDSPVYGWPLAALRWPDESLRAVLIRALAPPLLWVPPLASPSAWLLGASPALATQCARPLQAIPARRARFMLHAINPLADARANACAAPQGRCRSWASRASVKSTPRCWTRCCARSWSSSASTRRLCWGVGPAHLIVEAMHFDKQSSDMLCRRWCSHLATQVLQMQQRPNP